MGKWDCVRKVSRNCNQDGFEVEVRLLWWVERPHSQLRDFADAHVCMARTVQMNVRGAC
jgi:hypothetical protein